MAVDSGEQFNATLPLANLDALIAKTPEAAAFTNEDLAYELLRLSQEQVPLGLGVEQGGRDPHPGALQNSGTVQPGTEPGSFAVGYNMVYAARLHEHPEFRFNHGRKGKYLEDPLKNNEAVFGASAAIAFGQKLLE